MHAHGGGSAPQARLAGGQSQSETSRATGLDRKTVRRFARAQGIDELLVRATTRESRLDKFKPYLCQRWNGGVRDAAVLQDELRQQGWAGSAPGLTRTQAGSEAETDTGTTGSGQRKEAGK